MNTERKKLYKARELAEIMRVHPQTIYRAGERGEIESYRIGKSIRFCLPDSERNKTNDTERKNTELHQ